MTLLTIDQILSSEDRCYKEIDIPEWPLYRLDENGKKVFTLDDDGHKIPGTIRLGTMTSLDRDGFEAAMIDIKGNSKGKQKSSALFNFRARLVAACLIDNDGNLIATKDKIVALGRKNADVINRIFDAARKLNGMTSEGVEEIEEN